MLGTSLSRAIAYVTRTPVLRQASVVPSNARSTTNATMSDSDVPAFPAIDLIIEPMGAGSTAAAL